MSRVDRKVQLLALMQEAGIPVEPEYQFAPPRRWTFDWRVTGMKLAIEYEGGMFGAKGAKRCPVCKELPKASHFAIDRIKRDAAKYGEAAVRGWAVIRILPTMVDDGSAIALIKRAVMVRRHMKEGDDGR